MCNCITAIDVVEIKLLMIKSTMALYTGDTPYEEFSTDKGKEVLGKVNELLKQLGLSSFTELFQLVEKELGVEINIEEFMPKRVFVQPLVGEYDSCIAYTEANDLSVFISSKQYVSKFTTTLVVRENGKWLIDSLVS